MFCSGVAIPFKSGTEFRQLKLDDLEWLKLRFVAIPFKSGTEFRR